MRPGVRCKISLRKCQIPYQLGLGIGCPWSQDPSPYPWWFVQSLFSGYSRVAAIGCNRFHVHGKTYTQYKAVLQAFESHHYVLYRPTATFLNSEVGLLTFASCLPGKSQRYRSIHSSAIWMFPKFWERLGLLGKTRNKGLGRIFWQTAIAFCPPSLK